jgi:crotonobetainyl-CoA:carnitine CoA-transferase CaiB-like acyl-CoA transferase
MNILCLMRKGPDATISGILEAQRREHAVTVVDIRTDKDYGKIVELVFSSDSVISW